MSWRWRWEGCEIVHLADALAATSDEDNLVLDVEHVVEVAHRGWEGGSGKLEQRWGALGETSGCKRSGRGVGRGTVFETRESLGIVTKQQRGLAFESRSARCRAERSRRRQVVGAARSHLELELELELVS